MRILEILIILTLDGPCELDHILFSARLFIGRDVKDFVFRRTSKLSVVCLVSYDLVFYIPTGLFLALSNTFP